MSSIAYLQKAYLAYFGRPVDATGIAAFGPTSSATDAQVNAAFFNSAESQALYGTTFGVTQINAIYQMLFGRQAEPAGLAYWANEVARGAVTPAGAAVAILNGAQNADLTATNLKLAASAAYSAAIDTTPEILAYTGNTAAQIARDFLATVTTAAPTAAAIDANILVMIAGSTANAGTTFTLVTAAETLVGTAFNDTFNAFTDGGATSTLTAADSINGGAGIDTLNVTLTTNAVALPAAAISNVEVINARVVGGGTLNTTDLSSFSGLTTFNADRATGSLTTTNLGTGGSYGIIGDNIAASGANINFGYAAAATTATLNLGGGVKSAANTAVALTGTGVTATVINTTGTAANTLGATGSIATPATSKTTTINAASNLTTTLTTTADTKLVVTGTGVVNLNAAALNNAIVTVDASAQTAGGLTVTAGNAVAFKYTGGAGVDTLTLGAVLAGGAADGGAGTDVLVVAGNSAYITAGTGALIKNFEVLDLTTATVDLDNLAANNTLTGLRVGGSATVSNLSAATAANVTVYANATPVLNVKGATTPGQLDVVTIDVNDGAAAVNTITLTAPTLTAVETLNLKATDHITVTSLANALALTGMSVTGAGNVSITTTAIALNPNVTVDASAATGNFTLDATGATANGYTIKGSAGTNIITGGAAPIIVDLTKSAAKADQVIITSATGSTAAVLQTISGFTNSATVAIGDKLDVINTGTIAANAAAAATGVANLSGAIASGIITFSGTAAATATLQNKIDAAATLAGTTQYNEVAFEHAGNTYVYEQGDTVATYAPGVDLIVQLTGVTGVTALSTTASGATTIWAV